MCDIVVALSKKKIQDQHLWSALIECIISALNKKETKLNTFIAMPTEFDRIKLKSPKLYGIFVDYIVARENPLQEMKNISHKKVLRCL